MARIDDLENLDLFVQGEFGDLALIDGEEIWGVFDENYQDFFDSSYASTSNVEGRKICLMVRTDQIEDVEQGSTVEVKERDFEVVNIRPIEDGKMTDLILKEIE